jgi:HPt (histidine-containing phosphotransfer) domain-containing protein
VKPLTLENLEATLRRWIGKTAGAVDLQTLKMMRSLSRGGETNLLGELIADFNTSTPGLLQEMEMQLGKKNAAAIRKAAHLLNGKSGNVGAKVMLDLTGEIERLSSRDSLEKIGDLLRQLRDAFDDVRRELESDWKTAA